MPCDTPPRSGAELFEYEHASEAAELLPWVLARLNHFPVGPTTNRADMARLCGVIKGMTPEQRASIVYDAHNRMSRRLANWWEDHQRYDEARAEADEDEGTLPSDAEHILSLLDSRTRKDKA